MLERVWRKGNIYIPTSYIVGGNINRYSHYGSSLKKLKLELPCDLIILLLGIYTEKIIIQKGMCTPMLTGALFTITRTQKQLKCRSTEEWIKNDVVYIYNGILLSHKRNNIGSFIEVWLDLETVIYSEIPYINTCM